MKKDAILSYLIKNCPKDLTQDLDQCTTKGIMQAFNMKVTAANYQLNELHKDKELVKINTKPVFYIPIQTVIKNYGHEPLKIAYQHLSELLNELDIHDEIDDLIGSTGSLAATLRECKVAISYPGGGLPILLNGPTGSGKTFLAKQLFEYGQRKGIFPGDAPFQIFNCAEYVNNPELLSSKLFGYIKGAFTGAERDTSGLLENCDGGMLLIDEVHRLTPENQEKLFTFIDDGIYQRIGENNRTRLAQVYLIFATTEKIHEKLLPTFLRRIPIITHIPGLDDRGPMEKRAFIYYFFAKEAKRMKRNLEVDPLVMSYLSRKTLKSNVGGLENMIKHICANAYLGHESPESLDEVIHIDFKYVPEDDQEIEQTPLPNYRQGEWIHISPDNVVKNPLMIRNREAHAHFYKEIAELYSQALHQNMRLTLSESKIFIEVNRFLDVHKIELDKSTLKQSVVKTAVRSLKMIAEEYKLDIDSQCFDTIAAYTAVIPAASFREGLTPEVNLESLKGLFGFNEELCESYLKVVDSLIKHDIVSFSSFDRLVITSLFAYFNDQQTSTKVKSMIVAHGFSSASSMASTANRFIGQNVFRSFNMPIDVSFKEIGQMLRQYLKKIDTRDGVIILLDIGHVKDVFHEVSSVVSGDVGVIDNVSMKMALDVGTRILNKQTVAKIIHETSHESYAHFAYYPSERERSKALIITCQTGIGTAVKIKTLIEKCLPKNVVLDVIAMEYAKLNQDKEYSSVFRRYHVIGIIGTLNPNVDHVPFVGLEELMGLNGADYLKKLFHEILTSTEIQNLNNKLLKTLSLGNVINTLTILNPEKTLQLIETMVKKWEKSFSMVLPNDLIIGLYIHLSSMIERVITRNTINSYEQLDDFVRNHDYFINKMNDAFALVEENYHTKVPVSEIAYIHDMFRLKIPNFQY